MRSAPGSVRSLALFLGSRHNRRTGVPGRLSGSSTLLFYIPRHVRSPIVLGFQGLLRIASEFVGLYQAARTRWKEWVAAGVRRCAASVGLKNGRADAPVRFDRDCVEDAELPCFRCVDPDRALFGAPPRSWDPHAIGEHVVPGRHLWLLYTLVLYSTAQRVLLLWGDYSIA